MRTIATIAEGVYEQSVVEARIAKIRQKLLWYDVPPPDAGIVELVKEWRELSRLHSLLMRSMDALDAAEGAGRGGG